MDHLHLRLHVQLLLSAQCLCRKVVLSFVTSEYSWVDDLEMLLVLRKIQYLQMDIVRTGLEQTGRCNVH